MRCERVEGVGHGIREGESKLPFHAAAMRECTVPEMCAYLFS